jgi:hypothetical protein
MAEAESRYSLSTIWAALLTFLLGGFAVEVHRPVTESSPPELPHKQEVAATNKPLSLADPLAPLRDFRRR